MMKVKMLYLIMPVLLLSLFACNNLATREDEKEPVMPGYNLEEPERFPMTETLLEISGIAFRNNRPDSIYAIQDEEGKLFTLTWQQKEKHHTKFARNGDYEDVTVLNDRIYILKSNGHLYSLPVAEAQYEEVDSVEEYKDLLPKGEYESLYGNAGDSLLYVLCKNCKGTQQKETVTGYRFRRTNDRLVNAGTFQIDVESFRPFEGKVKHGLRPSAMGLNPVTGEWVILSAINKLLVVAAPDWKVKGAYYLSGNTFNQPEGIAFDTEGNMYISNEGDDLTTGNILKFHRARK